MDVMLSTARRQVFRVDPDAWRWPDIAWDYQDLIDLAAVTATSASPWLLVPASLSLMLPAERVRSWAVVVVDEQGGLHKGPGDCAAPSLFARAVTWLWALETGPDAYCDGAAYVDTWRTSHAAEAVVFLPLTRNGVVSSVISVWLTAPDTTTVMRDISRLTILGHLWTGVTSLRGRRDEGWTGAAGGQELTPRQSVILRAMARGLTNVQIAREISFSESTVRLESMCIYRHFGVHSRTDAVETAREAGAL